MSAGCPFTDAAAQPRWRWPSARRPATSLFNKACAASHGWHGHLAKHPASPTAAVAEWRDARWWRTTQDVASASAVRTGWRHPRRGWARAPEHALCAWVGPDWSDTAQDKAKLGTRNATRWYNGATEPTPPGSRPEAATSTRVRSSAHHMRPPSRGCPARRTRTGLERERKKAVSAWSSSMGNVYVAARCWLVRIVDHACALINNFLPEGLMAFVLLHAPSASAVCESLWLRSLLPSDSMGLCWAVALDRIHPVPFRT